MDRLRQTLSAGWPFLVAAALVSGCSLWPWRTSQVETVRVEVSPVEEHRPVVFAASPAYRLLLGPEWADVPSRLLVLYARIENAGDQPILVRPGEMRFRLPDETSGRVFDRARAVELIRRTDCGVHDLSYVHKPPSEYFPGGLHSSIQSRLDDQMLGSLLDVVDLSPGAAIEGFLVVDAGQPVASLDGALLELVGTRPGDSAPVHETYRFAATLPGAVTAE